MTLRVSLFAGLLAAQALLADFNPANWQYRRRIAIAEPQAMLTIKADNVLFSGSRVRLADVRIVHESTETPFITAVLRGVSGEREVEANIFNKSLIAGPALQLTLNHKTREHHNRIRLLTTAQNFKHRVQIETSADGAHWAIARSDASIFDVSEADRPASSLTVDYPVSTERFVRVTIFGWTNANAVSGAWITFDDEHDATHVLASTFDKPAQTENPERKTSEVTVDMGSAGIPHDVVRLEIEPGMFSRSVELEASSDGKAWRYLSQASIWRTAQGDSLDVEVPEDWDRYLRLRILNRDDRPLIVRKISVESTVREIRFPAADGGQYWIYYGNSAAQMPSYDLAEIAPLAPPVPGQLQVTLGPQEANPAYQSPIIPPKPFSEQYPGVLYAVLAASILVMGYVAFRLFAKVNPSSGS